MAKKFRWKFSLALTFLAMVVLALPLAWIRYERERVKRRDFAISEITSIGGDVWFDYQQTVLESDWVRYQSRHKDSAKWDASPPGAGVMRFIIGKNYAAFVDSVFLDGNELDDISKKLEWSLLEQFPRIRTIVITDVSLNLSSSNISIGADNMLQYVDLSNTNAGDSDVALLHDQPNLDVLLLNSTQVTSEISSTLSCFPKLQRLGLRETAVSDPILSLLSVSTSLQSLDIAHTSISASRLDELSASQSLSYLDLSGIDLTDLEACPVITNLEVLLLDDTNLRASAFATLVHCKKLRTLSCRNTRLSDDALSTLLGLPSLRIHLDDIDGTPVSNKLKSHLTDVMRQRFPKDPLFYSGAMDSARVTNEKPYQ